MNRWKIKIISCYCLLALIGCGGAPDTSDDREAEGIMAQEMITEWNKIIQSATKRFTKELSGISGRILSEFKAQTEKTLKGMEEREVIQAGRIKEDLVKELSGAVQSAIEQFTKKLNEVSNQVLSDFKTQTAETLKGMGEKEADRVHSAVKDVTGELDEAVQSAVKQFAEKLNEVSGQVLSEFRTQVEETLRGLEGRTVAQTGQVKENLTKELDGAIQRATEQFTKKLNEVSGQVLSEFRTQTGETFDTAIRRFKGDLADQIQETAAVSEPEPLDPVTKIIGEARPVIRDIVRNSELFLDFKVEEIVQKAMEKLNIRWAEITTAEDKKKLIERVMSAIHNGGQKHTVKNVHTALMSNIRHAVHNIPNGIKETVGLKGTEKITVTNGIHSETEKAVKEFIDERIRRAVGQAVDVKTAEEAVYALQFDIRNTPLHRGFGKPIHLFVSLKKDGEDEEMETFPLSRQGDCVKIKKEYLSSVTLVLQYTNPVTAMNFPYPMIELCNQTEGFKCQAGHYNIEGIGKGQGIDYVLKWRKAETDQFSSCPEFPEP